MVIRELIYLGEIVKKIRKEEKLIRGLGWVSFVKGD